MSPRSRPARVAIVNDYEIVVKGLAAMLAEYGDRIEVVELDNRLPVASEVDIVLFDSFANVPGDGSGLRNLVRPDGPKVVVFTWSPDPESIARAKQQGAAAHLSKCTSPKALADALEDIHAGVAPDPEPELDPDSADWPGRDAGLSAREAEVIALIARGFTNQEIAVAIFLSVNSVKTYVRTAYRKIGVRRRGQAVVWALQHGFAAEQGRSTPREG